MINTEYEALLQTARRQFGQYRRMAGVQYTPEESEIAFSELYRPIYKMTPSKRNVAALQKRIDAMSVRKVQNAFNKDTAKRIAIENFKDELYEKTKTQIGQDGNPHILGDTAKAVQKELYNFFDDAFNESMGKLGITRVYNTIEKDARKIRKKIARLVAIMYSSEYRDSDGTIKLTEATETLYSICETLKISKAKADKTIQAIRTILDISEAKKAQTQNVGLKNLKKG